MTLTGKKIIVGISGSIAAYKAATLVRLLVRAGAEVQVLMTPAATEFISPLTLSTLSKRPVYTSVIAADSWNNHVELGLWADAMVVAPATAATLARLATGLCDNALVAVYLSARCPVFVAPAMDVDMWHHPSTRHNVAQLVQRGNHLIPVGSGELASGLHGEGRLAEPEDIVAHLTHYFARQQDLHGYSILVTAGPTYEPLDPVRYLGNHSTGKMGVALALEAAQRGAQVTLVLGPSALQPTHSGLTVVRVQTADEMYAAAKQAFVTADVAIFAAAVADYRPAVAASQKIKKTADQLTLELVRNPDIAAALGQTKRSGQVLVGFALETQHGVAHALDKLSRKHLDFIVLNSLEDAGAGFGHDTNKITLLDHNMHRELELKTKQAAATDIIDEVRARLA